jgi:hypothetical protein
MPAVGQQDHPGSTHDNRRSGNERIEYVCIGIAPEGKAGMDTGNLNQKTAQSTPCQYQTFLQRDRDQNQ